MIRAWDVQYNWNPWLSVGFHLDHTDPSLTLHLPLLIVAFGRLKQPGFRHSLFRPVDRFGRPTKPSPDAPPPEKPDSESRRLSTGHHEEQGGECG